MEADWDEVAHVPLPPPSPNVYHPTPVTTLAFDTQQELLWAGNEYGRLTSFYGPELQKYTCYRGHPPVEGPVKQILPCEKGILSLSVRSIHLASRRGPAIWHLTHDGFSDLRCISFTAKGAHEVLVAGLQDAGFKVDVEKGLVTQTLTMQDRYSIMKRAGQYICAATNTGSIHLLDPSSLEVVKTFLAYTGWINDMDARSDFLVTCGYSSRQNMGYMLEPLAKVFDLKTLRPLPPIPFQAGAAYVRMHPKMSTTAIVASQGGQLQVVDLMNPNTVNLRQASIYECVLTAMETAPSGEALAMTDSIGFIRLWGSPSKIQFTEYSSPTEFADQPVAPPSIEWNQDTPLNSIGMPYYKEILLSAWPSHFAYEVGAPPTKLDAALTANLKRSDLGGYAPWPRKTRRYQVEDTRAAEKLAESLVAPKFLSEKAKDGGSGPDGERRMSEALEALTDIMLDGSTKREVPVMYRNVEIKYSKFGVDDFDFEYYNKTQYSGLETHIANSYANPLLQIYRFTTLIRNASLMHTATSCLFDNCLLCELGFLIDMLEKAAGQNCQATNFLKTFSGLSSVASLGLLEEHAPNTALTAMIQSLNRFLLDKMVGDFRMMAPQQNNMMDQVLMTAVLASIRCAQCGAEELRPGGSYVHDLIYPPKNSLKSPRSPQRYNFSQILKQSVERSVQNRAWCNRCKRYQQLATRQSIQRLPAVLMINAAVHSQEAKQLWATPGWLPQEIGIIIENGQFYCYEGQDLKLHLQRGVHNIYVFELVGVVADINSGENQKPHLVSVVNVAPVSRDPDLDSSWHLLNDFLVRPISTTEALSFNPTWKLPSILAYQTKSASHRIDDTWKTQLDTSLLYRRFTPPVDPSSEQTVKPLDPTTEHPHPGVPVAIDAEFISLQQEEIEVKSDGTRETIRPSRYGLARVSVLRGEGEAQEQPFIDDYIAITEPIVDYLTAWSGISPGDLDRNTSRHTLVSLKCAYKKLWILLNLGCVFVGHGLPKDFRTINIHIPRNQVVDTVNMYFIPERQRKLSLRFLAWVVLREEIQIEEHDSIEDARTALKLWRKYQEYEDAGVLQEVLGEIYKKGREVGFKAPGQLQQQLQQGGGAMAGKGAEIGSIGSVLGAGGADTPGAGGSRPVTPNAAAEGLGGTPSRRSAFQAGRGVGFGSPSK